MTGAKRTTKPGPLSKDLDARPTYKASMRAEQQKFGREDEPLQLALFGRQGGNSVEIKVAGLDLTVSEDRALAAIQKMLDKTDYKGNKPGEAIESSSFKGKYQIPRLMFTWKDFYEAYGIEEYQDKRHQSDEARDALLQGLTKPRLVCYERKRWEGAGQRRRQVVDIIRTASPLVKFCEYFEGLSTEEASRVEAGEPMTERVTRMVIEVSPLLLDGIDNFFLLKPASLHREISQLHDGKRVSRAVSLFIEYLLTVNMTHHQIMKETLVTKLRLSGLVRQRKTSKVDGILEDCLETAKQLGYLLGYSIEPGGRSDHALFKLHLNSQRCQRIRMSKKESDEKNSHQSQ